MSSCHIAVMQRLLNIGYAKCYFACMLVMHCKHSTCLLSPPATQLPLNFSVTLWGSSKLTWFYFGCTIHHLQTERDNSSLYLALPRLPYLCAVVFSCSTSSPMGTEYITLASSLMKTKQSPDSLSKPSFCHLPGIQMVQVYTSQHNALSFYIALFDMMCGSFVKSRHKVHSLRAKPLTLLQTPLPVSLLKARIHNSVIVLCCGYRGTLAVKKAFH